MIELYYRPLDDIFYMIGISKKDRLRNYKVRKMSPSFIRLARFSENFMNSFGLENMEIRMTPSNLTIIRMMTDGL